jgi:hypothetical protein
MIDMADLSTRARGIVEAFQYHAAGKVVTFWDVLIDENGYIWSRDEDADVEFLVEQAILRPVIHEPSNFLKTVAVSAKYTLNPRRVWQVTDQFKRLAAA